MTRLRQPISAAGTIGQLRLWLVCSIAIGTIVRLLLAAISDGTNDFLIWHAIATRVSEIGLLDAYRSMPEMNHPPLAVLWSRLALAAGSWFSLVMKIPAIVGDALSIALLGKIWLARAQLPKARAAMIAMALCPIAILISGYHCNTDNLYAYFSLLSMYLISMHSQFFLGGLALGAAINVKLIPVLLIPIAISMCRSWKQVVLLGAGLVICAIPFLPLLLAIDAAKTNMLGYVPPVSRWGVAYILYDLHTHPRFAPTAEVLMRQYQWLGRWAIIAAVSMLSLCSWSTRRWNAFELGTIAYGSFLVLAPGFGNQYLVILIPLLLAVSISRAWLYACLAAAFSISMYWAYLESYHLPLLTRFPASGPAPGATIGLLAWGVLATTVVWVAFRRGTQRAAAGDQAINLNG